MPDKELMGCTWSAFHTRARKQKKSKSKLSEDEDEGYEVMLFATEGLNLPRIPIHELLNWFMPIKLNYKQSSCKAFARLELGMSITWSPMLRIDNSKLIFVSRSYKDARDCSFQAQSSQMEQGHPSQWAARKP